MKKRKIVSIALIVFTLLVIAFILAPFIDPDKRRFNKEPIEVIDEKPNYETTE